MDLVFWTSPKHIKLEMVVSNESNSGQLLDAGSDTDDDGKGQSLDYERSKSNTSLFSSSNLEASLDNLQLGSSTTSSLVSLSGSDSSTYNRPIDERFQTRFSSLVGSFNNSTGSASPPLADFRETGNTNGPIRWSKLRKISNQIFSESAEITFGKATCLLVASIIAIGTSKGLVLVFDYHQNLKAILGRRTNAIKCGEITSLAISSDHTHIASGHCNGHIFTWELTKPKAYILHVHAIASSARQKVCGHILGTRVIHLSFVGKRHSVLISGGVTGMAFMHIGLRAMIGRTVETYRIVGRYPGDQANFKVRPTTLLGCAPLPPSADQKSMGDACLVAVLTPNLLALVSANPTPRTEFKTGRPKTVSNAMGLSGCLAWFPAFRSQSPRLAYCWSNVVTIMEVAVTKVNDEMMLSFAAPKRYVGSDAIVSMQWMSDKVSIFECLN